MVRPQEKYSTNFNGNHEVVLSINMTPYIFIWQRTYLPVWIKKTSTYSFLLVFQARMLMGLKVWYMINVCDTKVHVNSEET